MSTGLEPQPPKPRYTVWGTQIEDSVGRGPSVHDGLAVASFIAAWFFPLLGIILGGVSVSAAHRDNRDASGLAVAAIWIGSVAMAVLVIVLTVIAVHASQPPQ